MSDWETDLPFAPVPMWIAEQPISDRALRLYTLLAGMRDYGSGQASYGRKLLAKKLRCSLDSLDRAKVELEDLGAISIQRGGEPGRLARNVYTIHRIPAASRTPAAGLLAAPERLPTSRTRAAMNEKKENEKSPTELRRPKKVDGKVVGKAEHDKTDAILLVFNALAERNFAGAEWRRGIIMRLREHPELEVADHERIIQEQLAHPWWKGDPTPAVIYGRGDVFDRALNGAKGSKREEDEDRVRYTRA